MIERGDYWKARNPGKEWPIAEQIAEQIVEVDRPDCPPKGMTQANRFWQDHSDRYDECTCAEDDYQCLLGDAEHYADFSDYDMPGCGSLIRSAKSVITSFESGPVWKARS